jgi:hypothetical protein
VTGLVINVHEFTVLVHWFEPLDGSQKPLHTCTAYYYSTMVSKFAGLLDSRNFAPQTQREIPRTVYLRGATCLAH